MASRCEVRLYAPDEPSARAWADAAIAEVRRIEAKYSRYRNDSVTSAINAAAGLHPVEVDAETAALIDFGATLHAQSEGRFDLTSGVLRRAWRFSESAESSSAGSGDSSGHARLPSQQALDELLALVGWSQVLWRDRRIRLAKPGMELDFGGIGKEYAADRAAAAMEQHGARRGFVDLGGDIRSVGPPEGDTAWHIAIQHPRGAANASIGSVDVVKGAVATSGDYERYFELGGVRYCHILDPRTGWPARHWQSVSVHAPVCVAAGACATIAMLMPVDEARAFLQAQGLRHLAVAADGTVIRG